MMLIICLYHPYKCMCSKHKDGFMIEVRKESAAVAEVCAMQLIAPVFAPQTSARTRKSGRSSQTPPQYPDL